MTEFLIERTARSPAVAGLAVNRFLMTLLARYGCPIYSSMVHGQPTPRAIRFEGAGFARVSNHYWIFILTLLANSHI